MDFQCVLLACFKVSWSWASEICVMCTSKEQIRTVIDQHSFLKISLPCCWIIGVLEGCGILNRSKGIVGLSLCDRVGQVAGRVDISPEHIDNAAAGFLAWKMGSQDGGYVGMIRPG